MPNPFGDFQFTPDADYLIGEDGDIASHKYNREGNISALREMIAHRLAASKADWRLYPNLSAGLDQIIGEQSTEEVFNRVETQVRGALTNDYAINPNDLQVRVIDIGEAAITIMIWIKSVSDKPVEIFAFDMQSGEFISQVR